MEDWNKYILENVENDKVLHFCVENIRKNYNAAAKAIISDKNQMAAYILADTDQYIELLNDLDNKINGDKKTTVVA